MMYEYEVLFITNAPSSRSTHAPLVASMLGFEAYLCKVSKSYAAVVGNVVPYAKWDPNYISHPNIWPTSAHIFSSL